MGAKQAKSQEPGGGSPLHGWRRTPTKERGSDLLTSLVLKSGDRLSRHGGAATPPPPYQRRIGMIQEMMLMAKQGKQDEVTEMLKTLRLVRQCVCVALPGVTRSPQHHFLYSLCWCRYGGLLFGGLEPSRGPQTQDFHFVLVPVPPVD